MPADTMYGIRGKAETLLSKLIPNSIFLTSTRRPDNSRSKTGSLILSTSKRRVTLYDLTKPLWLLFILAVGLPSTHASGWWCSSQKNREASRSPRRTGRHHRKNRIGSLEETPIPRGSTEPVTVARSMVETGNGHGSQNEIHQRLSLLGPDHEGIIGNSHAFSMLKKKQYEAKVKQEKEDREQIEKAKSSLSHIAREHIENNKTQKARIEKEVKNSRKHLETAFKKVGMESITDTFLTKGFGREWIGGIVKGWLNDIAGVKDVPDDFTCVIIDGLRYLMRFAPVVFSEFFANYKDLDKFAETIKMTKDKYVKSVENIKLITEDFIKNLKTYQDKQFSHSFSEDDFIRYQNPSAPHKYGIKSKDRQGIFLVEEITDDYKWIVVKKTTISEDGYVHVEETPRELPQNTKKVIRRWKGRIWEQCGLYYDARTKKGRFPAELVFEPANFGSACKEGKKCLENIQKSTDARDVATLMEGVLGNDKASNFLATILSDGGNSNILSFVLTGMSILDVDKVTNPDLHKAQKMFGVVQMLLSDDNTAMEIIRTVQSSVVTEFAPNAAKACEALINFIGSNDAGDAKQEDQMHTSSSRSSSGIEQDPMQSGSSTASETDRSQTRESSAEELEEDGRLHYSDGTSSEGRVTDPTTSSSSSDAEYVDNHSGSQESAK